MCTILVNKALKNIPTRSSKAPTFFAVLTAQMRVAVSEIIARVSSSWDLPGSSLIDWRSTKSIQSVNRHTYAKRKREREKKKKIVGLKNKTFGRLLFLAAVPLDVVLSLFARSRRLLFLSFAKDPRSLGKTQRLSHRTIREGRGKKRDHGIAECWTCLFQ